jgi:hypothetical protein
MRVGKLMLREQNTSMHRLEAIPDVRNGAAYDDA